MKTIILLEKDLPICILVEKKYKTGSLLLLNILSSTAIQTGVNSEDILGKSRFKEVVKARNLFIKQAMAKGFSKAEVARFLRCNHASINYHLKQRKS